MNTIEIKALIKKAGYEWAKDGLETFYTTNIHGETLQEALNRDVSNSNYNYCFNFNGSGIYGMLSKYTVTKTHKRSSNTKAIFAIEVKFIGEHGEPTKTPTVDILL